MSRRSKNNYSEESYSSEYDSLESAGSFGNSAESDYDEFSSESYGSRSKKVTGVSETINSGAKQSAMKSGSQKKKKAAAKAPNLTVRALSPYEHDALNAKQTIYRVWIEGTLSDLASEAGHDAEGNEKPLRLYLGNHIQFDAATEDIQSRAEANRLKPNATIQVMSESPEKLADFRDIVTSVYVTGHSEIPRLEIVLDNLKGSAESVRHSEAKNGVTQSCVIRCEGGNRLTNKRVLHNDFDDDDLSHFQRMAVSGAQELNLTPKKERDIDGVPFVSVEINPSVGHDVVRMIQRDYKNHPQCSEAERRMILRKRILPESVLKKDKNHANVIFVQESIYNHYRAICEEKRKRRRPLSDVAHPFGVAARMVNDASSHFTDTSKDAMHVAAKKIWTNLSAINIGSSATKDPKTAIEKRMRGAWFEITVNHLNVADIPKLNTE